MRHPPDPEEKAPAPAVTRARRGGLTIGEFSLRASRPWDKQFLDRPDKVPSRRAEPPERLSLPLGDAEHIAPVLARVLANLANPKRSSRR